MEANPALNTPGCAEFFAINHLPPCDGHATLQSYWRGLSWDLCENGAWTYEQLCAELAAYLDPAATRKATQVLQMLEISRGRDKSGAPETHDLCFLPGDVICIVGPTGSGKSRLLADIECLAQGDTPTGRTVRINGHTPAPEMRFSVEHKIVAQISQNMNFVMDLSVSEFLQMHAESRALASPEEALQRVLEAAVSMAGEPFGTDTPLTQLSGGQSRALMIADAAYLSPKPVVLIDEIENAGVDRLRALRLFVEKEKIVLLSTHDPLLALSGTRRLVIANGGVKEIITPSANERKACRALAAIDQTLGALREEIRRGGRLDSLDENSQWIAQFSTARAKSDASVSR